MISAAAPMTATTTRLSTSSRGTSCSRLDERPPRRLDRSELL
jgi:hypothetical protein